MRRGGEDGPTNRGEWGSGALLSGVGGAPNWEDTTFMRVGDAEGTHCGGGWVPPVRGGVRVIPWEGPGWGYTEANVGGEKDDCMPRDTNMGFDSWGRGIW
jgi:hypothetical protein